MRASIAEMRAKACNHGHFRGDGVTNRQQHGAAHQATRTIVGCTTHGAQG